MAGIMVYIPGGGTKADFPRLGLEGLLEPHIAALSFEVATGPDGGAGSMIGFDNPYFPAHTPTTYDAATQTWLPAAKDGDLETARYWLGYVTAQRPRPEELQRLTLFDGEPVELDDHFVWVVPVADLLPQRMARDSSTGREASVPKDEHAEFVKIANDAYNLFLSDGFEVMLSKRRITIPQGYRLAVLALQKNYRVNADVIDLLGLLDEIVAINVSLAVTGISVAARVLEQKKSSENPSP